MKKDQSGFLDDQGKEALNFQITVVIASVVSWILTCVWIGVFLIPGVYITNIIFCILAAIKVNDGERYRYPVTLRLIS